MNLDLNLLTEKEKHILDGVWTSYFHWNGLQLSTACHTVGSPWDTTIKANGGHRKGLIIENELIKNFYNIKSKNGSITAL